MRVRAEGVLRKASLDSSRPPTSDVERAVHDLRVHQIELEMQNEELKIATRELERARTEYQSLYDDAPVGYLSVDAHGIIRRANLAAAAILGVAAPRLVGRLLAKFVEADDLRKLYDHMRAAEPHSTVACELRLGTSGRSAIHARLETRAEADPSTGHRIVLIDITDRKRAERALEELNQELEARIAERTIELAERNKELEAQIAGRLQADEERRRLEKRLHEAERLEGLGLLAGGIAHDFNNLLVGVVSNVDLMLEDATLTDDVREGLTLVRRAGLSAADLTRQMLIYAGQGRTVFEPVDLNAAVTEAIELLRGRMPKRPVLEVALGEALPAVAADRVQIQQVVANLVLNASEAIGDASGKIEVSTRVEDLDAAKLDGFAHRADAEPGRFVVLRAVDTGPGIDPGTLVRIFDPFYTTKFAGRGLGLASVLGIVRAHRGALHVESEVGRGTRFEIAWPLSAGRTSSRAPPQDSVRKWKGAGRVLVVDDDSAVRNVVAEQLQRLGFEVTPASGGADALRLFDSGSGFALAVVDQTMPGLSGEQLIAALRERDPDLPAVLMSGYRRKQPVGADDRLTFLQKPMTTAQLSDAVRAALASRLLG